MAYVVRLNYDRPNDQVLKALLSEALRPIHAAEVGLVNDVRKLEEILHRLTMMALTDQYWLHPEANNPVEHHLFVTHMMARLAVANHCSWPETMVGLTAALLHDVCPNQDVQIHMQKCARAASLMLRSAPSAGWYGQDQIQAIVDLIAIHDDPELGVRLPPGFLPRALREADCLWTVTKAGIKAALNRRDAKATTTPAQLRMSLESLRTERDLHEGPFPDQKFGTFFNYINDIFQQTMENWECQD